MNENCVQHCPWPTQCILQTIQHFDRVQKRVLFELKMRWKFSSWEKFNTKYVIKKSEKRANNNMWHGKMKRRNSSFYTFFKNTQISAISQSFEIFCFWFRIKIYRVIVGFLWNFCQFKYLSAATGFYQLLIKWKWITNQTRK